MEEEKSATATEKAKLTVEGQNYMVINMIGPGLRQHTQKSAIRVLGCFATEEEARKWADKYRKIDNRFDLLVCSMYYFLPVLDELHEIGDIQYTEREINNLLDVHHKTRTQTEEWNQRLEHAQKGGEDKWGALTSL
jgi:hypothetical protein